MEFMTNLQSGLDEQKPSLFELISEQQLASLIPPSLRYLLALATHRHPRYLLRILNSFDELYLVLSLFLERHYLRTHHGSFTENFYSLKRERVLAIRGGEIPRASLASPDLVRETLALKTSDVWKNLAILVGLPYVKRKLDEAYDIHAATANLLGPGFRGHDLGPDATLRQRIFQWYKWFLRKVYPGLNATYYLTILAFNLAYLFDTSKFHSPFQWLVGTRIRRMNSADHRAIAAAAAPKQSRTGAPPAPQSLFSPRTLTQTVYPRLMSSAKILLPTAIFALKFLEWWHASDFARQLSRKAAEGVELPAPTVSGLSKTSPAAQVKSGVTFTTDEKSPAEKNERETENGTEKESNKSAPISSLTNLPILTVPAQPSEHSSNCPICLSPIVTPTATQTGFVFCYTCVFKWVEGEHPRQLAFMEGNAGLENGGQDGKEWVEEGGGSRGERWEDGRGRCAVTGRRLLGGTGGLRRVMV